MPIKRASPLAARVYKLEEAVFKAADKVEPKTAPPPSTCMLYGELATIKSTFEMYLKADAARNAAEKALAECRDQLTRAQGDFNWEKNMRRSAESRVDSIQAALQRAEAALPKAGTVVTVPSHRASPFTMGETICLVFGLALGVLAGAMFL